MDDDHTPYCWQGCKRPAMHEYPFSITVEGEEVVVLVCCEHYGEANG